MSSNLTLSANTMKASERRKHLKKVRRFEKEIKEDLKADIGHFIAEYYLSQWADLEAACKELLLKTGGPGFLNMRRRDLIKHLEDVTEALHGMNDVYNYVMFGKKTTWGRREQLYSGYKVRMKEELKAKAEALLERLMAEIIGISVEKTYEPEGRKPDPKMEYYTD